MSEPLSRREDQLPRKDGDVLDAVRREASPRSIRSLNADAEERKERLVSITLGTVSVA